MTGKTFTHYLTPKQIAEEMGINCQALTRMLRRGDGPKFKRYGARYLIRKDWYEAWIEKDHEKCSA